MNIQQMKADEWIVLSDDGGLNYTFKNGEAWVNGIKSDTNISHLSIPNTLTVKHYYGLYDIRGIWQYEETVELNVVGINSNVFRGCKDLTEVTLSEHIREIGSLAFDNCNNLVSVSMPGVKTMDSGAFRNCQNLVSVSLLDIISLGSSVFENCSNLVSISFGSSLEEIGSYAFKNCYNITSFIVPESVEEIGLGSFYCCVGLESIILNSNLKKIGNCAFQECTNLKTVKKGLHLEEIFGSAFRNCTNLESVEIGTALKLIESEAFSGCTNLKSIQLPEGLSSIGNNAFSGCSSLETITIPNSVMSMGGNVFYNCTSLQTVYSYGVVGNSAFNGCSALQKAYIYNSVGEGAFNNTNSLEYVYIDGDHKIEKYAFNICEKLSVVAFGPNVVKIPDYIFWLCRNISEVTFSEGLEIIGEGVFSDCRKLSSIELPNTIKEIRGGAFAYTGIQSIRIPNNTKIGPSAFVGCTQLTKAVIGDYVEIGHIAFQGARLKSIKFGEFVKLGNNDQDNCIFTGNEIDSLYIPGTTIIEGKAVFDSCIKLVFVSIDENLKKIGEETFLNCFNLRDIYVHGEIPLEGNDSIFYCSPSQILRRYNQEIEENHIYEHAELHVPAFRGFDYRLVSPWKNFRTVSDDIGKNPSGEEEEKEIIKFADSKVKEICLKYWDTNEDGELSMTEAASVLWIGNAFVESEITSFNEFSYFTAVTDIDDAAFRKCKNLKEITLPNSATSIGKQTFAYCLSLTKVVMPNTMTSIGDYAFMGCNNLASIELSDNLTKIGDGAFESCSSLSTINIPASVFYIGGSPFDTCSGLTSINVNSGNMRYCSIDGVLFDKACTKLVQYPIGKKGSEYVIPSTVVTIGEGAFISSTNLHTVIIPESVTTIELGAFMECTSLEMITIPQSVTSLAKYSFYGCTGLKSVTSMNQNPFEIESNVFETSNNTFTTATLYVPAGSASKYQTTEGWKNFKKFILIGDVNGDNTINDADTKDEADYIMGNPSKTYVKAAGDMNGDGVINVADIVLMRNVINSK